MATQDTDVATAEVGGDASSGFSSSTSSRNTQQRAPGGFNPSVDGGVNAAQQARVSGAAAMDEAGYGNFDTPYAKDAAGEAMSYKKRCGVTSRQGRDTRFARHKIFSVDRERLPCEPTSADSN